jgi:hypothetical protein
LQNISIPYPEFLPNSAAGSILFLLMRFQTDKQTAPLLAFAPTVNIASGAFQSSARDPDE